MKKVLLFSAIVATLGASAHAVQKCVYRPTMDNWEVCDSGTDGLSDASGGWWINCDGQTYRGIAAFSTQDVGSVSDVLVDNIFDTDYVYCYCKMISPALSKWIKVAVPIPTIEYDNKMFIDVDINEYCATHCVEYGDDGEGYAESLLRYMNNLE